jgi:ribonuclease G
MSEADEILHSWGPGESRLALIEGGRLVELVLDRAGLAAGAVFMGRVAEVALRLDAAFVDIGAPRPGFLPGAAALKLSQGQAVLVQVRADAHDGKGATLTAEVSLAGRFLAYSPMRPGLAFSRRLEPAERDRLAPLLSGLIASGEGVVVRSAAEGREGAELAADLDRLRNDWAALDGRRHAAKVPGEVWRPDALSRMLADNPRVARVRMDDAAAFAAARARFPSLVELHKGGPLFDLYDTDEAIEGALAPVLRLPSGGRLAIEPTAALTAIDVDSGSGPPTQANREAVDAIARQLRLRAIGGQVAVDFVSGGGKGAVFKLMGALKRAVAADPTPTHVFGVTPLGLVELTRERRGPSLAELLVERTVAPMPEAAALAALRRVLAEAAARPGAALALSVAPEVAEALARNPTAVAETEQRLGRPLPVRPDATRRREDVLVEEQKP